MISEFIVHMKTTLNLSKEKWLHWYFCFFQQGWNLLAWFIGPLAITTSDSISFFPPWPLLTFLPENIVCWIHRFWSVFLEQILRCSGFQCCKGSMTHHIIPEGVKFLWDYMLTFVFKIFFDCFIFICLWLTLWASTIKKAYRSGMRISPTA